nr:PREDICTED: 28S ribosomal protein S22, mitochondrial isoform X1 [Megachile rotundata]
MMSSRSSSLLRQLYKRLVWNRQFSSTAPTLDSCTANERDPAPIFFDERIQDLLVILTRIDYEKVFAPRKEGVRFSTPECRFMTDEELKAAQAAMEKKARGRLQMPPVVKPRVDANQVLSKDFGIQGFSDTNIVFTDISFGGTNRHRLIVVREPSGILRHANTKERHRMNQVYFPIKDREIHTPKMFSDPYFKDLLEREEFVFILDRACLQFEPDDSDYQKITQTVYSTVNQWKKFDALRSTRHFGPMAFYLTWEKKIDDLLQDVIKNEKIEEAAALIRLYHLVHPDARSGQEATRNDLELIRRYAELDAADRFGITKALDKYELMYEEKQKVIDGIKKSHGQIENTDEPKT